MRQPTQAAIAWRDVKLPKLRSLAEQGLSLSEAAASIGYDVPRVYEWARRFDPTLPAAFTRYKALRWRIPERVAVATECAKRGMNKNATAEHMGMTRQRFHQFRTKHMPDVVFSPKYRSRPNSDKP